MDVKNVCRPSTEETVVITFSAYTQILGPDNARTAVTFSVADNGVRITTLPNQQGNVGMAIDTIVPVLGLCQCHQGDWVKRALYGKAISGTCTLTIICGYEPSAAGFTNWKEF